MSRALGLPSAHTLCYLVPRRAPLSALALSDYGGFAHEGWMNVGCMAMSVA